jgi:hypothetical protein
VSYGLLADAVLVLHFAFVLFVAAGGLLALKWPRAAWLHVPAAIWGVAIELGGWICPLTPIENHVRQLAGESTYPGDFIGRHLLGVVYPEGLTRGVQVALGAAALAVNLAVYTVVWRRRWRSEA